MTNIPQYEVYIENFGAKGDGVNDDALALQAAINSLADAGGMIKLLPKKYYFKTQVTVNHHSIIITGTSVGLSPYDYGSGGTMGTQIICTNGVHGIEANNVGYFYLKDLQLWLASGATSATHAVRLISCFNPKIDNVRTTNFSTGVYMHGNADTYINGMYLSSIGVTVDPVVGIDIDGSSHAQNASVYISNCISAHGTPSGQSYGYYLHGNRINDVTFSNCETDGCETGFLIDGTAVIDAGYGGDIHLNNCIADQSVFYGVHINNVNVDGMVEINGGWSAGPSVNVQIDSSRIVNVRGMEIFSGGHGIYYHNSGGDAIANQLYDLTGNALTADNSPSVGFVSNKGLQKLSGANFISLINNSTRCRLIGNSVDPAGITAGYTTGISTSVGCDYAAIIANDVASVLCTTPYSLNLSSNTHTVRLDVDNPATVATATGSALGICRPDNATITISSGVLTAVGGGGGGVVGPAFSAYGNTSVPSSTFTKCVMTTVEFDTASCFSTTNARFTPNVAGYYNITGTIFFSTLSSARGLVSVFKNGSEFKRGNDIVAGGSELGLTINTIIYLNGSTDYVELYSYQASGSTQPIAANSGITTYFQGVFIRS